MSFTKINPEDFVVSADSITAPAWSSNIPTLSTFFTASSTSSYYLDVYNTASSNINAAVQFSIAYGDVNGTGSSPINNLVPQFTPTKVNYSQYRNLVYGNPYSNFNFGTGNTNASSIVILSIDRNRYKQSMMPGTFNLTLGYGTAPQLKLTDNSNDVSTVSYLDCGRVYNIVSGSNGSGATTPLPLGSTTNGYTVSGSYGLFLPDIGTIILNPAALNLAPASGGLSLSFSTNQTNTNNQLIFQTIVSGSSFQLLSQETVSSDYVFVRIKNAEYNYTSNPSFVTGSGDLVYSNFINSPQTFPTTVGLYNTNNELLAVAKLSTPLVKDFTKEALIRVKLDW